MLRLTEFLRINDHLVEIKGGYYEARRGAPGNTYLREGRDGEWVVVGDEVNWIS